ncbi:MAG: oligosaccharide flippase family protein [Gemmatimonas sp.]
MSATSSEKAKDGAAPDLLTGVAWTGALRWIAQIVAWAATLLLVRLLTPADYGIAGIAGAISTWTAIAAEFGLSSAVLTGDDLEDREYRQLHTLAIVMAGLAAVLMSAASGLAAVFFDVLELRMIVPLLGVGIVIDAFRAIPTALLARRRTYRTIASIELVRALTQTVLVLGAALAGYRFWSFVIGQLGGSLVATAVMIRVTSLRPTLAIRPGHRPTVQRARMFFGGAVAWQTYRNADIWIIGRVLGPSAVGAFTLTRSLASIPIEKLVSILTSVTPGYLLSARSEPAELRRLFLMLSEAVLLTVCLPLAGLAVTADLAIPVLLGEKWMDIVMPLRVLAVAMVIWSSSMVAVQVATLSNALRSATQANIVAVPVALVVYYLGARYFGLVGVASAAIVVVTVVAVPTIAGALRATECSAAEYAASWRPALAASLAIAVAVLVVRVLTLSLPNSTRFGLSVVAGAAVGVAIVAWSSSPLIEKMRRPVVTRLRALWS